MSKSSLAREDAEVTIDTASTGGVDLLRIGVEFFAEEAQKGVGWLTMDDGEFRV
jgi:hypothetical protein